MSLCQIYRFAAISQGIVLMVRAAVVWRMDPLYPNFIRETHRGEP